MVQPRVVVVDPLSSLLAAGERIDVQHTVVRLIDFLKRKQITTLLTAEDQTKETSETGLHISSIIDTWIRLEWDRTNVPFQRRLSIVKKRGTGHTRSYLPFEIGSDGFKLEETHDG